MKQSSLLIRPATPDPTEASLFAHYMNQASEGFFSFMLGKNAEQIISRAFLEPNHALSYECVVLVEHDGAVAGMCSAFTGAQHRTFTEEPLKRAAGRRALRMRCVRTLMGPLWHILDTIPEGDFYLQGMAVEPGRRGAGIGSRLMSDAEERARAGGSARLSLDVSAKNEGARRLYARRGMVESSRWPASRFVPTVFVRMSKDL